MLVDAAGQPLDIRLDANTIVVGAATWCPHCAEFEQDVAAAVSAGQLAGLRIVFAFGDEGGAGPGGVRYADVLDNLPGDVAFLAPESAQPSAFPMAFNPTSGAFDQNAYDAVNAWYADQSATAPAAGSAASDASSGPGGASVAQVLYGDFNQDGIVNAADYTVWRDTLGQTGEGLAADVNGDLVVDATDYGMWKTHFGADAATALPGEFTITGPESPLGVDEFTITWDASPGATNYELVISDQMDLSNPFLVEEIAGTSRAFTGFGYRTVYFGVTAQNDAGTTAASNGPFLLDIPPLVQVQTVFVSSIQYGIDFMEVIPPFPQVFGSAAAADYHCTYMADQAGLLDNWDQQTRYFRAMITLPLIAIDLRAQIGDGNFVNVNGEIVATGRAQLYSGVFSAPLLDELGDEVTGANVPIWTGATSNGGASGLTCDSWTNPAAAGAKVGNLNGGDSTFLDNGTRACNQGARLVCVGIRQTPLPESP